METTTKTNQTGALERGATAITKVAIDHIPAGSTVTVRHVSTHTNRVGIEWDPKSWQYKRHAAWVEADQLEVCA